VTLDLQYSTHEQSETGMVACLSPFQLQPPRRRHCLVDLKRSVEFNCFRWRIFPVVFTIYFSNIFEFMSFSHFFQNIRAFATFSCEYSKGSFRDFTRVLLVQSKTKGYNCNSIVARLSIVSSVAVLPVDPVVVVALVLVVLVIAVVCRSSCCRSSPVAIQ